MFNRQMVLVDGDMLFYGMKMFSDIKDLIARDVGEWVPGGMYKEVKKGPCRVCGSVLYLLGLRRGDIQFQTLYLRMHTV